MFVMCFVTDCQRGRLLGSKKLGTNVLELQFVLCWQTMIKTQSLRLGLLKVCLFVKLESSDCKIYWTKSARLDRSKIRLDRSNHVQIYFSVKFQFNPNSTYTYQGSSKTLLYIRETLGRFLKFFLERLECLLSLFLYLRFCTQMPSKGCSYCGLCKSLVRSR